MCAYKSIIIYSTSISTAHLTCMRWTCTATMVVNHIIWVQNIWKRKLETKKHRKSRGADSKTSQPSIPSLRCMHDHWPAGRSCDNIMSVPVLWIFKLELMHTVVLIWAQNHYAFEKRNNICLISQDCLWYLDLHWYLLIFATSSEDDSIEELAMQFSDGRMSSTPAKVHAR